MNEFNYHIQESPLIWLILNKENNENQLYQLNINSSVEQNNKLQILILVTLIIKYSINSHNNNKNNNNSNNSEINEIPLKLWRYINYYYEHYNDHYHYYLIDIPIFVQFLMKDKII